MPKMKRHKGLAKRTRVSARGKVRYKKSNAGHLMSGKSGSRRRSLRRKTAMARANNAKALRALLA